MSTAICLGLISGTSLDAIDAAACRFDEQGGWQGLLGTLSYPYPSELRSELLALQAEPDRLLSLRDIARLDAAVGDCFAQAAATLMNQQGLRPTDVAAIGSHGQTVFHDPDVLRTSLQLGDPNRIAALTGIATIGDLRRADMALGGQGAPLVPAFHQALFSAAKPRAVINIGGIANITVLPARSGAPVFGFDTGPGNALMDEWIHRHREERYDRDGQWAASGQVQQALLAAWLSDPYFAAKPPKSTGRDYFKLAWAQTLAAMENFRPEDVQASLLELTVESIAQALLLAAPDSEQALICGGGASNRLLMQRLAQRLAPREVISTEAAGLHPDWVEAAAFAWLAWRRLHGRSGNLPAVTGARKPAVLGGLYLP